MRQHALSLSLGSRFGGGGRNGGASPFDGLELDFEADSGTMAGASQLNSTSLLTVTRALAAYADDTAGVWTSFGVNVARRTNKGLLVEEARTNSLRNNSMQGAVVGSPGTAPTNWGIASGSGVSTEIIAIGTENGIDYIDVRWFGTSGTTAYRSSFEANNTIAASVGQTWTNSVFVKLIAAPNLNNATFTVEVREFNGGAASGGLSGTTIVPTSTLTRYSHTRTLTDAVATHQQPTFRIGVSNGNSYDFTLRFGWPQAELGAFVTSPIRTTAAAVTRPRDQITIGSFGSWFNASEGTMYAEGAPYTGTLGTSAVFHIDDGTANNQLILGVGGVGSGSLTATTVLVAGASQQGTSRSSVLGTNKVALGYKLNDFAASFNGEAPVLDTAGTIPVVTTGRIADTGGATWSGYIKHIGYARTRLTDAVIAQLTAIGATLNFDFINNTATIAGTLTSSTSPLTVSRASTGYAESSAGVWTSFGNNVARRTDKGLLVEEARTNSIRNNSMQNAVAGTPGTLPTNWAVAVNGVSTQVVGTGTEDGLDYIDLRIFGIASSSSAFQYRVEVNNNIVASNGQVWTASLFHKLVGGSLANISTLVLQLYENNAAGATLTLSSENFTPTSIKQRATLTRTFNNASTAFANLKFSVTNTNGAAVDVTFRIYMPQLELGAFVTSPIRTTAAAATRAADAVSLAVSTDWYSALTGALFAEAKVDTAAAITGTQHLVSLDDGTANERFSTRAVSAAISGTVVDGGVAQATISVGTLSAGITAKTVMAWLANDIAFYVDNVAGTPDAAATLPTATGLKLGARAASTEPLNGYLRSLRYYSARLPNTLLQALTI
jgi:hypothetical protein